MLAGGLLLESYGHFLSSLPRRYRLRRHQLRDPSLLSGILLPERLCLRQYRSNLEGVPLVSFMCAIEQVQSLSRVVRSSVLVICQESLRPRAPRILLSKHSQSEMGSVALCIFEISA